MTSEAHGGRVRRVVLRTLVVAVAGAGLLAPILYYASTVDVRPPQVDRFALTQHLPGDDGVALTTASMEIVFSETVDHSTAESAFNIIPAVAGSFSWSGATLIFTPRERLPLETTFSVSLSSGVRDRAGNNMGGAGPFGFRTVGGPTVIASQPENDTDGVAVDAPITLTFSTLMDTLSVERSLELIPHTSITLRWSGQQLTVVPQGGLQTGQRYLLVISSQARDIAGTALEPLRLAFTTLAAGLTVRTTLPAPDSQGIAVTTPIGVVFDRPVDPGTVNDRSLTLSPAVSGGVTLNPLVGPAGLGDDSLRLLLFTPSAPLPATTTITITLADTLRAQDGSRLARSSTWTFTTGAPSSSLSNQIVFLSQRSGVANLWAMNPDGSNQHQVSAEIAPIITYAIAPDGRSLVVGDGVRLVEQRADGSGRRVLTETGLIEFDPAYSPDGSVIAFGRADASTGNGLGLWRRGAGGGTPERIPMTPAATPTPTPSSSASGSGSASPTPARAPLLRSPRYAPDGNKLAFVDMSGKVGVLDVRTSALTISRFWPAAPISWLPDSSAVVVSGLRNGFGVAIGGGILTPGTAVPPLSPAGLRMSGAERSALLLADISAASGSVTALPLNPGATLPAIDAAGRIAYLVGDPNDADAGRLWITNASGSLSTEVRPPGTALVSSVNFAPEPDALVIARFAEGGVAPSPAPSASATASPRPPSTAPSPSASPGAAEGLGGVWLVQLSSGISTQLSSEGWLPRWLP